MNVNFGTHVSRDARDQHGTSVHVAMDVVDGGWIGHYSFDTHGMTADDVAAKVQQLHAHHIKKGKRLDGFAAVRGVEVVIANRLFRVTGSTIREVAGEVELETSVHEVVGAELRRVEGFPRVQRFPSIDDVHDNGTIISVLNSVLRQRVAVEQAHASFLASAQTAVSAAIAAISIGVLP